MTTTPDYEVIVIGAGVAGIYQIKLLQDLGVKATVLELAGDLGGTWYWNRYPGARFDSESYTYGYSFSREVLDEWHWKERFSSQPENLKYLNFVADKFNLRRHMQFNQRVIAAQWDEANRLWCLTVRDEQGNVNRFLDATRTGRHLWEFTSTEPLDLARAWTVGWAARGDHEGQVAAGRTAGDADPLGIDAEVGAKEVESDRAVARARDFVEFDDAATAPLHGFRDAADYYAKSSSAPWLDGVRVPTRLIHAADDPFVPAGALPRDACSANSCIDLQPLSNYLGIK